MRMITILAFLLACGEKDGDDTGTGPDDGGATDGGTSDGGAGDGGGESCEPEIPASATTVSSTLVDNSGTGAFEVCTGGTLTVNTGAVDIYVHSGGSAVINAGNVSVWAEDGASVIINAGTVEAWGAPGTVIINAGTGVTLEECDVTFTGGAC